MCLGINIDSISYQSTLVTATSWLMNCCLTTSGLGVGKHGFVTTLSSGDLYQVPVARVCLTATRSPFHPPAVAIMAACS